MSQPSPTQSTEVPEEAEEAAAKALYELAMVEADEAAADGDGLEPEGVWTAESNPFKRLFQRQAADALQAAAPSIRNQERQRTEELERELEELKAQGEACAEAITQAEATLTSFDPEELEKLGLTVPDEISNAGITLTEALEALRSIEPGIVERARQSESQRIQEALKQPIHDLATHIGRARMEIEDLYEPPAVAAAASELKLVVEAMADLRAALDTLDPSGAQRSSSALDSLLAELREGARTATVDRSFGRKNGIVWARERVEAALDPSGDREPNADEWCCDGCGLIAPAESEGWEQTPQDDAGVTVERCPSCRLHPPRERGEESDLCPSCDLSLPTGCTCRDAQWGEVKP